MASFLANSQAELYPRWYSDLSNVDGWLAQEMNPTPIKKMSGIISAFICYLPVVMSCYSKHSHDCLYVKNAPIWLGMRTMALSCYGDRLIQLNIFQKPLYLTELFAFGILYGIWLQSAFLFPNQTSCAGRVAINKRGRSIIDTSNKNKVIRSLKYCWCARIITTGGILYSWGLPWYAGHNQMVSVKFASEHHLKHHKYAGTCSHERFEYKQDILTMHNFAHIFLPDCSTLSCWCSDQWRLDCDRSWNGRESNHHAQRKPDCSGRREPYAQQRDPYDEQQLQWRIWY